MFENKRKLERVMFPNLKSRKWAKLSKWVGRIFIYRCWSKWSKILNIRLSNDRVTIDFGLVRLGSCGDSVLSSDGWHFVCTCLNHGPMWHLDNGSTTEASFRARPKAQWWPCGALSHKVTCCCPLCVLQLWRSIFCVRRGPLDPFIFTPKNTHKRYPEKSPKT